MAVTIKNMDMPKTCSDCQFCVKIAIDEEIEAECYICLEDNNINMKTIGYEDKYLYGKPEWCQLEQIN